MNQTSQKFLQELLSHKEKVKQMELHHWLENDLFSWQWWLSLAFSTFAMFLWIKIVDRKRIVEILLYGSFIAISSTVLDIIGSSYLLWEYPDSFEPIWPPMFPADLVILPAVYMFVYQVFDSWKPFWLASIVLAALLSFVGEPLVILMGSYEQLDWSNFYSFPIYILMAVGYKALINKVMKIQKG